MAPTTDDVVVERSVDGTSVVVFSGEHDLHSSPRVKKLLDSLLRQDDLVVADFSSAQFVDSSILRVLLDTHAQALELGKVFRLQLDTSDIVGSAFERTGVFTAVEHVTTREEALRQEKS